MILTQSPGRVREALQRELARRLARNPLIWIDGPRGTVPLAWTAKQEQAWTRQVGKAVFGFIGGNRLGKTVWAAAHVAQLALGIPRIAWPTLARDPRAWPLGPAREIWCTTITFEKSRDVQQRALWERIPRKLWTSRWHPKTGFSARVAELTNGTKFVFKSCEQGLRTFEGSRIDAAWIDETIPLAYFLAILPRCIDRRAPIIWTTIPDDPLLDDLFVRRALDPGTKEVLQPGDIDCVLGAMRDNPHLNEQQIRLVEALLPVDERGVRIYGRFAARQRLVYGDFAESLHVRAIDPPLRADQWANRVEVIDPGWSVPCAVLFATIGRGNSYGVYDEIYRKRRTVGEIAAEIYLRRWTWRGLMTPAEIAEYQALAEPVGGGDEEPTPEQQLRRDRELRGLLDRWRAAKGDLRPRMTLVDEAAQQRDQGKPVSFLSQLRQYGIVAQPAPNRDKDGQRRLVRELLRPLNGLVRLWVAPRCEWTIWEFQHHREKDVRPEIGTFVADKELVLAANDHTLNCIEYLAAEAPKYAPLGAAEFPPGSIAARHAALVRPAGGVERRSRG